jgi:hypothetical protein
LYRQSNAAGAPERYGRSKYCPRLHLIPTLQPARQRHILGLRLSGKRDFISDSKQKIAAKVSRGNLCLSLRLLLLNDAHYGILPALRSNLPSGG